jgi:hypothetical protein
MLTRGLAALCLVLATATALAQPGKSTTIFDVNREKAQRAIVTELDTLRELEPNLPPMAVMLHGAIAELKGPKLDQLRSTVPNSPMLGDAGNAIQICTIHLFGKPNTPPKRVAIYRDKQAEFIAVELDSDRPDRCQLKRDAFAALYFEWPNYRGSFDPTDFKDPIAQNFDYPKPYTAGRFVLDARTVGDRLLGGGISKLEMDRVLDDEKFSVRLPQGYSPKNPAGLLVWVNAMNSGAIPTAFAQALDQLNLVGIGADESGNNRQVTNRQQLAVDAVACASQRYHIDPRRIYVTGISGGGKVSSMLQMGFPDIFTGSVPIVGLACYQSVPSGTSGRMYPATMLRPKPDTFTMVKTRRIAPMTGRNDFNEVEIQQATAILRLDGLSIKLFDDAKMGHELPKPEHFLEALSWVDEPAKTKLAAEREAAAKALEAYTTKHNSDPPKDEPSRRLLYKVMEAGPWTPPAWQAAELLGLTSSRSQAH